MTIRQLSVFLENKSGRLAEITETLAEADIHILALSIADAVDYGVLRLIVDQPDRAVQVLKNHHCAVSLTNVIAFGLPKEHGAFARVARVLADHGIGLEYCYAFNDYRASKEALGVMRVEDNDKAIQVLQENGVTLVSEEEILSE
ncbi:MAG: hypothetical protein PUC32_00820 [Oscillospiraceae bacterium]|nr:hypothetical protein [Oscillospiraceae bacterium]